MKAEPVDGKRLVSVSEIARLADVGPSAVSNWRSRHSDFPVPVESGPMGDLFELGSIEQWMRAHGRTFAQPSHSVGRALWQLGDSLRRQGVDREDAVLLTMQLLYVGSRAVAGAPTSNSRVSRLWSSALHPSNTTQVWNETIHALSGQSPELTRVLTLPNGIQEEHLVRAMQEVAALQSRDIHWGPAATALLRHYQQEIGLRGAFQATTASVADLIVALLQPVAGVVYDPACGLGMVLTRAWRNRSDDSVRMFGQEINEYSWRLGFLHLATNDAPFELATGDTLRDDRFRELRADRIVIDPPFGQKIDATDLYGDERWVYGATKMSSQWLWAQQLQFHLADDGIGVLTSPTGALVRTGVESDIRRRIVESDMLDAVIELPPGVHAATSAPLALLVFARGRQKRRGRILFIDGRQLGAPRRGKPRDLRQFEIDRIASTLAAWRAGTFKGEPRFAADVTFADVVAKDRDFTLSPSRYVQYEADAITSIEGERIEVRVARLRADLSSAAHAVTESADLVEEGASSFVRNKGKSWPLVRLGDLLIDTPRTGMRQELDKAGLEVPYVLSRLVTSGPGHLDQLPNDVTRGDVRGRVVTRGDLLLASRGIEAHGRIGCATVRFDGEAAYAESLMRIRLDRSRAEPDFIRQYLTSRHGRETLAAVTTGSVIANLRADALLEIRVPLPTLEEQRLVVDAITRVEQGIAELSRVLNDSASLLDALRDGVAAGMYVSAKDRAP